MILVCNKTSKAWSSVGSSTVYIIFTDWKSDASVSPFIGVRRKVITLFITADLSDWTILEYPPDAFFSAPSKIVDSFLILSAVSSPYKSWIHISYWDTGW